MAFVDGDLVEISMRINWIGSVCMNVFQYEITDTFPGANAAQLGEAWWNHVKTVYRALSPTSIPNVFDAVIVRELNDAVGEYGEFAVPTAERTGTRSTAGLGDIEPNFVAAGVRLTVGTRTTRPGQKRLPFVWDTDVLNQQLVAAFQTLVTNWANVITDSMLLGAPTVGLTLQPIVVRKDVNGQVVANQPVLGYIINVNATSQVSRKLGRGI